MSVADRMAILENGVIRQIDTPLSIYDRPASRYVAGLLGSPQMNMMEIEAGNGPTAAAGALRLDPARVPNGAVGIGIRPEDLRVATTQAETIARVLSRPTSPSLA